MNPLEANAALIDGAETALSGSASWSGTPVGTVGGNQSREAPKVLLDAEDGHNRVLIGNRSDDGHETDEQGNIIGERQRVMWEAEIEFRSIHSHETESYRLQNVLYNWFILAEKYPERVGEMVNEVRVEDPYTKKIKYDAADAVFTQCLPIFLRYEDTVVDDTVEPIDEFYNEFSNES